MKKRGVNTNESADRLNVIVEGSKVVGDFITESNLRIDGEVLGNVSAAAKVVIGTSGKILGNLNCVEADIEGRLDGLLNVEKLLTLRSSANVIGEITTSKIQIEEGANFSGNCVMNNQSAPASAKEVTKEVEQEDIVY